MITQLYRVRENGWDMGDPGRVLAYFKARFEAEEFRTRQSFVMSSYSIEPVKAIELPNGDIYLVGDKITVTTP